MKTIKSKNMNIIPMSVKIKHVLMKYLYEQQLYDRNITIHQDKIFQYLGKFMNLLPFTLKV